MLQPGWAVTRDTTGQNAGFSSDAQGKVLYRDSAGNEQTLYPVFADITELAATFGAFDPAINLTGNAEGAVTARFLGANYTLIPDYTLTAVPSNRAGSAWWQDGNEFYIRNRDASAQGFSVR